MNLNIITDQNGDKLISDSVELYDDSNCGNSTKDYEILRQFSRSSFDSMTKVRSKRNQKIYAMKEINLSKIEDDTIALSKKELAFLQELQNPHVIKYFNHFDENGKLYIITEFMNNGNLLQFIETYKSLETQIKEGMLWNIFLQCMTALSYIHSKE